MNNAPVTFLYDFNHVDEKARRWAMHEFAANGAKHLVLTEYLIGRIFYERHLADTLQEEMAAEGLSFMDAHAIFGIELVDHVVEVLGQLVFVRMPPLDGDRLGDVILGGGHGSHGHHHQHDEEQGDEFLHSVLPSFP